MSISRRAKSRLLMLAAISGPVLAAQAMRLVGASGPALSSANVASVTPPAPDIAAVPPRKPEPTPEQTRALQWLLLRSNDRAVRCPMDQPAAPPPPPAIEDPAPPPVTPVQSGPDPVTTLTLTAIMADHQASLARINGKVYAVGSTPLKGWTVSVIDADNGMVRITHADGREASLYLKRPDPSH